MAAEIAADTSTAERQRLKGLIEKVLPVARVADGIARRSVGKVGKVALLGTLAAAWLSCACVMTFAWGLASALTLLIVLMVPSLVLWKIHATLKTVVGLPARMVDTCDRLFGKFTEYRQLYAERGSVPVQSQKPRFKEIWKSTRSLLELKALNDEGREIFTTLGGAVVMTNPLFAIVLFAATTVAMLVIGIAIIVGLAFIF